MGQNSLKVTLLYLGIAQSIQYRHQLRKYNSGQSPTPEANTRTGEKESIKVAKLFHWNFSKC